MSETATTPPPSTGANAPPASEPFGSPSSIARIAEALAAANAAPAATSAIPATPAAPAATPAAPTAPSPAPAAPPTINLDDESVPGYARSDEAKTGWKTLKAMAKQHKAEAAALKVEIEKLKGAPAASADLEALRKERDDLDAALKTAALERHPTFQRAFKSKIDSMVAKAKEIVGPANAKIETLLTAPESEWRNKQLEEIVGELSPVQASKLGAVLINIENLQSEREAALGEAKKNYELLQQTEAARAKQSQAERESTFQRVFNDLASKEGWREALVPKEGDPSSAELVSARIQAAKAAFDPNTDPEVLAHSSIKAALFDDTAKAAIALASKVQDLEAQIAGLKSATPSTGGVGGTAGGAPDVAKPGMTAGEVIAAQLRAAGIVR